MRVLILLASTTMLAACGGAGPQSAGSAAAPAAAPNPVTGATTTHTFVNPTEPKSYKAVGGAHSYSYIVDNGGTAGTGQQNQLYAGDATTVRNSGLTIDYNPRDAIFDVSFVNALADTSTAGRYQDPLHRTDFGGQREPQFGVPNLADSKWNVPGINYLEFGSSDNVFFSVPGEFVLSLGVASLPGTYSRTTFFYQTPGTETQYVTFAGYNRNIAQVLNEEIINVDGSVRTVSRQTNRFERGAFAFGEITPNDQVPTTGTGSFEGAMLASMVFNDLPDTLGVTDTYFQSIVGRATTSIDFGANSFSLAVEGKVGAPLLDGTSGLYTIRDNAQFFANGRGQIDLVAAGGFKGQFQNTWFINPDGQRLDLTIAGSSIDGAFYGPNGVEVGGGYRIVGGTPDERIDILGTFVGKKK